MSQPTTQKQTTRNIILSYLSYLSLFIGTAFISGAIVHSGVIADIPKYIVIGVVGVALFLVGSFVQEFVLNRDNLREEGIVKFFLFSLLLSIGIGMISGGTQHFTDYPVYSSYLIPIGFVISLVAYLLKNNYHITKKLWGVVIAVCVLVTIPLYFGLNIYAHNLVKSKNEKCKTSFNFTINTLASGETDHGNPCASHANSSNENTHYKSTIGMDHDMSAMVKDDKTFIENMIPHHQEAVDSSTSLLKNTQDTDLISFANNVIIDQNKEIAEMKLWYKQWYNLEYTTNNSYMAMMGGMKGKTGTDLDKAYISGMIDHHKGAVLMAKKVFPISEKLEIRTLANNVVNNQNKEISTLENWLLSKYNTTATSSTKSSVPHMEGDGHAGH